MELRGAGARDCPGSGRRDGADARVDESRRARAYRGEPPRALLVALAPAALAERRKIGQRTENPRNTARLRQRYRAAAGGTVRRHRVSYGEASLFFSEAR